MCITNLTTSISNCVSFCTSLCCNTSVGPSITVVATFTDMVGRHKQRDLSNFRANRRERVTIRRKIKSSSPIAWGLSAWKTYVTLRATLLDTADETPCATEIATVRTVSCLFLSASWFVCSSAPSTECAFCFSIIVRACVCVCTREYSTDERTNTTESARLKPNVRRDGTYYMVLIPSSREGSSGIVTSI